MKIALLTCLAALASCTRYDSPNPTVSQQDAVDQGWGLEPRKVRGNPKLRYEYNARNEAPAPINATPPVTTTP